MAKVDLLHDLQEILESRLYSRGYSVNPHEDLDAVLQRYLNVARRLPPVVRWQIEISKDLSGKTLNPKIQTAIYLFVQKAKAGENLRPYISTRIEDPDYRDLLFYDWGIYHFHLSTIVDSRGFIKRTDELLFALTDPNNTTLYLLDVLPHNGSFLNQDLIRIIEENWPHIVDLYALRNVIALENPPSNEDIGKLRRKGVNPLIQTPGGRILVPMGGGITASCTSIHNIRYADWIKGIIRNAQSTLLADRKTLDEYFQKNYKKTWDQLVFKLVSFENIIRVDEMTTQTTVLRQRLQ